MFSLKYLAIVCTCAIGKNTSLDKVCEACKVAQLLNHADSQTVQLVDTQLLQLLGNQFYVIIDYYVHSEGSESILPIQADVTLITRNENVPLKSALLYFYESLKFDGRY